MILVSSAGENPFGVSGLTDWAWGILTASSPSYRTTIEPERK